MTFTPDGRMLIAERDGTVWVVQPGATQVSPTPFLQLPERRRPTTSAACSASRSTRRSRTNGYVYVYLHARLAAQPRVALHRHRQHRAGLDRARGVAEHRQRRHLAPGRRPALRARRLPLHLGRRPPAEPDRPAADLLQRQDPARHARRRRAAPTTRSTTAPARTSTRSGRAACATRSGSRSTRRPAACSSATSARARPRRSTSASAAPTTAGPLCEGSCGTAGMTNPIHSYPHTADDASITGGFVYRGTQFPAEYRGDYFFGDYAENWIKRLTLRRQRQRHRGPQLRAARRPPRRPVRRHRRARRGPRRLALVRRRRPVRADQRRRGAPDPQRRTPTSRRPPSPPRTRPPARRRSPSLLERRVVRPRGPAAHLPLGLRRRHDVDRGEPVAHLRRAAAATPSG